MPMPLVLLLPLLLTADEAGWPQWRGLQRDGVAPGVQLPENWLNQDLRVRWRVPLGEGYASPVVERDRVYTFGRVEGREVIQAHDLASGKVLWRSAYPAPYEVRDIASAHGAGPRATPVVHQGRLFTVGINEVLHALETSSGRVLWRIDFPRRFGTNPPGYGACSSPMIVDRFLILPAADRVVAVDWRGGSIVWKALDDSFYSSLIAAELDGKRQLVAFARYRLVGLDPRRGELLWSHSYPSMWGSNVVTPITSGDRVVVSSPTQGTRAVRVRGTEHGKWTVGPVWGTPVLRAYLTSPVTHQGHMYGLDESGRLHCIELSSGRTVWSAGNFSDFGTLVRAGNQLLILSGYGELTAIEATPRGYRELGQRELASSATWAHLVVVPGSMLVRDKSGLTCFELPRERVEP